MRLLSLLAVGILIAWLISVAVAAAEGPGGFGSAVPWLALTVIVSLAYAFAYHRVTGGR